MTTNVMVSLVGWIGEDPEKEVPTIPTEPTNLSMPFSGALSKRKKSQGL